MPVIATAGHVDHGKSTLVRRLTGVDPDRWAEERRRGLTIDLGFAWTTLADVGPVAFVDVPGHARFVPNMLAGIGAVPAVLFVVAADEGWMPQSTEHLAAVNAFAIGHGLLVVTKSDLADPAPVITQARQRLCASSLGEVPAVAVGGTDGTGLGELRVALSRLVRGLPPPDRDADVRLWIDRSFAVAGAGAVVTGTLTAGRIRPDDEFELAGSTTRLRVRALQALGQPVDSVCAVARVAVNLRGIGHGDLRRGDALVTPGAWHTTDTVDVRLVGRRADELARELQLHVGSATVVSRTRALAGDLARLSLRRPLPLRVGDRVLLREPGTHAVDGAEILDITPPPLARHGAAKRRADALNHCSAGELHLRRQGFVREKESRVAGVPADGLPVAPGWRAHPDHWAALVADLRALTADWHAERPLESGPPASIAGQRLQLPDPGLLAPLVAAAGLSVAAGRVTTGHAGLPTHVETALAELAADFAANPFRAPTSGRLAELRLGPAELEAAARHRLITRLSGDIVLGPDAQSLAAQRLSALPQPFTASQARQALATSRKVIITLLESLHRNRLAQHLPDGRHRIVAP